MATIVKTPAGTWKAVVRKTGWPTNTKTFRTKRDAEDWARRTEDEMVRGVYIQRSGSERLTLEKALERYLAEVTPSKKPTTRKAEATKAKQLIQHLGKYSLAALSAEIIANYRDTRLGTLSKRGVPTSNNTVRLELALLSHLYTVAIQEWGLGLTFNPVLNIRKPSPGDGRDRRLTADEERRLLAAVNSHSNPMLGWIVRIALDNPVRPEDCNLVFFGEPGKDEKRRPYAFTKTWGLLKKKLGMPDLRFHDLRHEAVSRLVEGGLSDQEVSAISGHKSMQMLKRYTHLRAEDLVGKLDKLKRQRKAS